jgi:hypothetical protein
MRLPGWLVIFTLIVNVLSLCSVTVAWCWINWPERTAQTFVRLIRQGELPAAFGMGAGELEERSMFSGFFPEWGEVGLEPTPMIGADMWHARRTFRLTGLHAVWNYEFTVQMGHIVEDRLFLTCDDQEGT